MEGHADLITASNDYCLKFLVALLIVGSCGQVARLLTIAMFRVQIKSGMTSFACRTNIRGTSSSLIFEFGAVQFQVHWKNQNLGSIFAIRYLCAIEF